MKILGLFCVLFLLCTQAASANTKTVCGYGPADSGYFITEFTYQPGCLDYEGTSYNAFVEEEYDNLNVNASMNICFAGGTPNLPAGWSTLTQPLYDLTCSFSPPPLASPPNRVEVTHTSCVNESQSLCYPSTISASPNPVSIPYDQLGTTTINFSSPGYSSVCLWVSIDGGTQTSVDCGGNTGAATANWIQAGHSYQFSLYEGTTTTTLLASVTVKGVSDGMPSLASSSNPVIIPFGQSSTNWTLTWKAPGYSQVTLYGEQNKSNPGETICLGSGPGTGSTTETVVAAEIANLYLTPYTGCSAGAVVSSVPTPVLATLQVTGQRGTRSTMAASPNPVTIPTGHTSANFTLSWNAPGYSQVTLYGEQNMSNPGKILCLGSGVGAGSTTSSVVTGEVANLYLVAYTGCTPGSVVASVPSPVLATLTVTAN